ncbi:hypothetical protein EV383_4458 [Pseudonocardia sediminis]|uniref:DUF1376 domain-containing protein n=1 Tax=Pseudonocardia sediminis TaxID=1397368 RepID=A0A4Q7V483_PSEST|nr:hypothetical protein [Pseudonocardia sediminis]RZT87533.1 hypothetical protein EV383_4458 [Pseudonocardia sediminis]
MARSMPADYREFIRLAVDLPDNPKLAMIDDPAASWAYVVSLCYCGRNLTDGAFPLPPLLRQAGVKRAVAKLLIDAGLWHELGHGCDRCPQPMAGMAVVHDYLEHQRSAGEAKSLRDARREAGRRGAASRWSGNSDVKGDGNSHSKCHSNGEASGMATGVADLWHPDGRPMPEGEGEGEEEKEQKKTPSSSGRKRPEIRLPASWQPTDKHRAYAAEHSLDLNAQRQLFTAHAEEKDRRAASWNGAFSRWLINAVEYRRQQPQARPALRLASGGYRAWQNPTDDSVYDQEF